MKVKDVIIVVTVVFLFCFQAILPTATAHTGGIFTIIVSENGVVPGNVQMLVNDTARWINVDDTDNITHRILVDANSDGKYDGERDWNSGNLTHECEHINGTKVDDNCNAYFDVPFNETYLNMSYDDIVGSYAFVDLVFNETSGNTEKVYGNVTVNSDSHLTAGFQDTNSNNENEEKKNDEDNDNNSRFLLIIAATSAVGAMVLGGMILFGNKED
tara:strand:- start:326 stop:970 length:645 start_codon:yes stop_codon:yes gene_type:complete